MPGDKRRLSSRRMSLAPGSQAEGEDASWSDNDDAAECKERRKSMALEAQRREMTESPYKSPRKGAAAMAARKAEAKGTRGNSADALDAAKLSDLYASCIKLSTENKINQKNSWELSLIDYISDVLDVPMGEMTNFQVASCTLDASVKIYSYRVDSIHSEAYKVLGGLTRSGGKADEEEKDEDAAEGEEGENAEKKPKKARARTVATIEANPDNLLVRRFDLEFDVDPLFHKTQASFDGAGPRGLLLNHLNVHGGCELVFDSMDAPAGGTGNDVADVMVDISPLRAMLFADNFEPSAAKICPQFSGFEFGGWAPGSTPRPSLGAHDEAAAAGADWSNDGADYDDDCGGYDSADMAEAFGDAPSDASAFDPFAAAEKTLAAQRESMMMREIVASGEGDERESATEAGSARDVVFAMATGAAAEYGFFDPSRLKGWTGPSHWRAAPVAAESAPTKKGAKAAFSIDFSAPAPDWSVALAEGKASTTLAQATIDKATEQANTLPEDVHYVVDMLTRLFLRPQCVMRFRSCAAGDEGADAPTRGEQWYNYDNPNDVNFCPSADLGGGGYDSDDGPCDDGDFGGDDAPCAAEPMHDAPAVDNTVLDGTALIEAPKMAEKIEIKYAKAATKVDVRVVKETMWEAMSGEAPRGKENAGDAANTHDSESGKGSVKSPQSFKSLVHKMPTLVAGKNAGEVSVAIAFVCLLHLANEKNLAIAGREAMDDLRIVQNGTAASPSH